MPSEETPVRVLVVTAHPDDVDFGAGGTIASWTEAGAQVSYCIITDGSAGALDGSIDPGELRSLREQEQRSAAAVLGVQDVTFLGYRDGQLQVTDELLRDLTREIRRVRPDRLLAQSPERLWERIQASHPDHLAAGEAALHAVYPDARNPFAHRDLLVEGLEPHVVPEVWLMASPRADRPVDITEHVDRKLAALRCHASQVGPGGELEDRIRDWASRNAAAHGLGAGRLAEVFQVVPTA